MPLADTKIEQALIQSLVVIADKIIDADDYAKVQKTKWTAKGSPSVKLNATQKTAINKFLNDLSILRNSAIVAKVKGLDQPSHGTRALE